MGPVRTSLSGSELRAPEGAHGPFGNADDTRRDPTWTLSTALLSIAIFAVDLALPLGVACGVLYVLPGALTLWVGNFRLTATTAAGCGVLTGVGYFLSPAAAEPTWMILLNRGMALLALGLIMGIARLQTRLDRTNEQLRDHSRSMRHLLEVGQRLFTSFDFESIQRTTIHFARDLFDADGAGLLFFDRSTDAWHWKLVTDDSDPETIEFGRAQPDCIGRRALKAGASRVVHDASHGDSHTESPLLDRADLRSAIAIPVDRPSELKGALLVGYDDSRTFSTHDELLLDALARLVALAAHMSHLYDRIEAISAQRERRRVANEVHDGIAQSFGYMLMRLASARRSLERGELDEAEQALAGLETLIEDAGDDVRTLMRRLRGGELDDGNLLRSPNRIVRRAAERAGVEIDLTADTDLPDLAAPVEFQADRIFTECFRNVHQHAPRPEARVRLEARDERLVVQVENDGGVAVPSDGEADPADRQNRHFGIDIMRERTRSLGGTFEFESDSSRTVVTLKLPYHTESHP